MESDGILIPQPKSENSTKYAAKFAKFEEFRQRREKERQERLTRIEIRKLQLRDRRVTEIQKSLNSLQLKPSVASVVRPHTARAVEKPQQPVNVLSADIKKSVVQLTRGHPGSVVKIISTSKESARRTTFATHGLPSTAKKLVGERVPPRNLLGVKNETIGTSQGKCPARAVKRHLLTSGTGVAKKPCLQPRNTNIKHENLQVKNEEKKLGKAESCLEIGVFKSKNETLIVHEAVQPQIENKPAVNDNRKKLTREQALELWRQKKLQETADLKNRIQSQLRRETLPATRPGLTVFPTAAPKTSAIRRTASAAPQARVEISKKKRETCSSIHVRSKIDSIRARPAQSTQKNSHHVGTKVAAAPIGNLVPGKNTGQKVASVKPESQKSGKVGRSVWDKSLLLETVFSAGEPATPELKEPRMSTPYSSKRVGSPLLQLSSIAASSRTKGLTNTWTPKTPKTPRSALSLKLEKWLAAHGKTPSRFRHLHCYGLHAHDVSTPQPSSRLCVQKLNPLFEDDDKKDINRFKELQKQLIEMFTEVTSLVNMGFPSDQFATWLTGVSTRIPEVKQLSHYWSCKAHLAAAADKGGAAEAMQILEEGARNGAQPEEELERARIHISEVCNRAAVVVQPSDATYSTHTRLVNEVQPENIFDSSSVKFSIKKLPNLQPSFVTPQKVVVTPVRRSTRRSCAHLPAGLRDHDIIVESADEIPTETLPVALFRSNVALNLQWRYSEPDATPE